MITLSKCALVASVSDLEAIKSALSLPVLALDESKTGSTVGEILRGKFKAGEIIPENLIIFHGITSKELDAALISLRSAGISSLKAVSTPTNMGWTVAALYKELCRERNSFKTKEAKKK